MFDFFGTLHSWLPRYTHRHWHSHAANYNHIISFQWDISLLNVCLLITSSWMRKWSHHYWANCGGRGCGIRASCTATEMADWHFHQLCNGNATIEGKENNKPKRNTFKLANLHVNCNGIWKLGQPINRMQTHKQKTSNIYRQFKNQFGKKEFSSTTNNRNNPVYYRRFIPR